MFRRTTGRRWRHRDMRGFPYEPAEADQRELMPKAYSPGVLVCPECDQPRPDDEQVKAGMPCESCEG